MPDKTEDVKDALTIVQRVVTILRDVLTIVLLVVILWYGYGVMQEVRSLPWS